MIGAAIFQLSRETWNMKKSKMFREGVGASEGSWCFGD